MHSKTKIDIVVPVLNEEKYIASCLDSILKFKVPENVETEIYIIDGMSRDKTKEICLQYSARHENIKYLENKEKIQSCALNLAIKNGTGDYIMRLDAHAKYPTDYLSNCIETSFRTNADNVGGIVITLKGDDTYHAALVQALTTHKFGVGDSSFRTEEKMENSSDTVPFGFFKKEIFKKVGFFDQRLVRAQDYEMNRRIIKFGGRIWLNSAIFSEYYNQPTLAKFLNKQFFKEAPYNAYMWYVAPYSFAIRHVITGCFTGGILLGLLLSIFSPLIANIYIGVLILYFSLAFLSSVQQAIKYKHPSFIIILPFCFFSYHFIHGAGVLVGLLNLLVGKSPVQKIKEPWPGAGRYRAFPLA
ncbi:MAG: glycosyltransferase family 2 protein [Sediminibacterium sp.]